MFHNLYGTFASMSEGGKIRQILFCSFFKDGFSLTLKMAICSYMYQITTFKKKAVNLTHFHLSFYWCKCSDKNFTICYSVSLYIATIFLLNWWEGIAKSAKFLTRKWINDFREWCTWSVSFPFVNCTVLLKILPTIKFKKKRIILLQPTTVCIIYL